MFRCSVFSDLEVDVNRSKGRPLKDYSSYIGKSYGSLSILSICRDARGDVYANCECKCGNNTAIRINNLFSGNTKSCGCVRYDMLHREDKTLDLRRIEVHKEKALTQGGTLR